MSELSFEHFDPEYELCNLDANGKPIKPRKKPGRKPNPPSPSQRKAQNRAAQRAFRERKRREMKEAETNNKRYRLLHEQALEELERLQRKVDELHYENGFLKGQVLTLKIACMANRVDVPKFWDTGSRDMMGSDITTFSQSKDLPQSLEFFLDHERRIIRAQEDEEEEDFLLAGLDSFLSPDSVLWFLNQLKDTPPETWIDQLPIEITQMIPPEIRDWVSLFVSQQQDILPCLVQNVTDVFKPQLPVENDFWAETKIEDKVYVPGPLPPLDAILKMRSTKEEGGFDYLLTPTELQQRIPHDARIDLVPGPTMRDYMILFQDYYDANELFNYLIECSVFIGGELGNPDCWFVPPDFIRKYWFLCPNYRPTRLDNSVEVAVRFAQKMVDRLKRRKEMYIMRDKHADAFPQPTTEEVILQESINQSYASLDVLVLHHINKDVPKIISPSAI